MDEMVNTPASQAQMPYHQKLKKMIGQERKENE
jgi:hypothetical protein